MDSVSSSQIHSDIDSLRPLHAKGGVVFVSGWCFIADEASAPPVRLNVNHTTFPATEHRDRADVATLFTDQPAALQSGFSIQGELPSGVYLAKLEALDSSGNWHLFQELTISASRPEFVAQIDTPISTGTLHDRIKVGGWALQPDEQLVELSLRYGHRELPCTLGLSRGDVALQFPDVPSAQTAGFVSTDFLRAGHGPVRLKAKLASGRTVVAHTDVTFSINRDENHEPKLDLTAKRVALPNSLSREIADPEPCISPLNILYVLHGSFAANSALHVAALANELCAQGHDCTVAVTHDLDTICQLESPAFRSLLHQQAIERLSFNNGSSPDIIHAWTTRENVRKLTEALHKRYPAKIVVHLEDNEQHILAHTLSRSLDELSLLPPSKLESLITDDLSHPQRAQAFLESADGATIITDNLKQFVPKDCPCHLITPAADPRYFYPRPIPAAFREVLDLNRNETVLFYHGNVHSANAVEVRELYAAVGLLNQSGYPTTLLRTGLDTVDFWENLRESVSPHVIQLGLIEHHHHLPALMALADIFVQPGSPDPFNEYRFPSKLPEFFSIGRPVILPRTNLGALVTHGTDAYVLDRADCDGIASAVIKLRTDRPLYKKLSKGAVDFAQQHFSWRRSADTLAKFYAELTTS